MSSVTVRPTQFAVARRAYVSSKLVLSKPPVTKALCDNPELRHPTLGGPPEEEAQGQSGDR